MADALQILGYEKVYHMREVPQNNHQQRWADLINAKSRGDNAPCLEDLESILRDYQVPSSSKHVDLSCLPC